LVLSGALCVALGGWAQEFLGRKDPGPVVLDEAAGVCLTLLAQPMRHWQWAVALAFVAFRVFDITKPPPARQLERLPRGWGILLDDLAAAVYANLVCQGVLRLW
jgi:phosphatidylglycerophosphatase A